nr:MAG TPA: hypothetical protein [Caudoviricetes sp.]
MVKGAIFKPSLLGFFNIYCRCHSYYTIIFYIFLQKIWSIEGEFLIDHKIVMYYLLCL